MLSTTWPRLAPGHPAQASIVLIIPSLEPRAVFPANRRHLRNAGITKKARQQKATHGATELVLYQQTETCIRFLLPSFLRNSRSVVKFFYPAALTSNLTTFKNVSLPTACGINRQYQTQPIHPAARSETQPTLDEQNDPRV